LDIGEAIGTAADKQEASRSKKQEVVFFGFGPAFVFCFCLRGLLDTF
jgi:hypothetical protein